LVCFALKSNSNPTLLKFLAELGLGADVTSGGELFLAMYAGFDTRKIVFSGVGKTSSEIKTALLGNIRALHVESEAELEAILDLTEELQVVAPITVRVNPDILAATHPHISTGRSKHKFGVSVDKAIKMMRLAQEHASLRPVGLAVHIGSQITDLAPFLKASKLLVSLAWRLESTGIKIDYLDIGGGLGIDYESKEVPEPADWVKAVAEPVLSAGYKLLIEPGRSIIGPTAILLTQVLYVKKQGQKQFIIVDAGMNDLIRPVLYNAYHSVIIEHFHPEDRQAEIMVTDIVGPICETGDVLVRERMLPQVNPGDLIAILDAGAYGFAMSSNYNGRLKLAEVLVDRDQFKIIRQRQTYEDLLAGC
jgi:diaminopimelate decarboxylase